MDMGNVLAACMLSRSPEKDTRYILVILTAPPVACTWGSTLVYETSSGHQGEEEAPAWCQQHLLRHLASTRQGVQEEA